MGRMARAGMALTAFLSASITLGAEPGCSPARDDADFMLAAPRLHHAAEPFSTVLAPDAIVATEVQSVDTDFLRSDRAIAVTTPLSAKFDAGQLFGHRLVDGIVRPCVYRPPMIPYQPPVDEEGRPFPTDCLEDRDGDGRYETILFFAYHAAAGHGIVEARIDPVRLEPLPQAPDDHARFYLYRRLRVVSVSADRVRLASDIAVGGPAPGRTALNYAAQPASEVEVPLNEGEADVGGLKLRLLHVGGAWTATPRGVFSPWVGLFCGNSRMWVLRPPAAGPHPAGAQ
jgi:hypothetical protein